jgi:tetratricopeptide (TPR) repeat protein
MAHNRHFLAFAAMMRGRSKEALSAARLLVARIPDEFLRDYAGIADGFTVFVPEVMMRFGMWNEILAEPEPRGGLPYALAIWRFTRAAALNALGRTGEAAAERRLFRQAARTVPRDATFGNNSARTLLAIASDVLDGEFAAKAGDYRRSLNLLRRAVRHEAGLVYDEPPDWIQPVRHTLGAVLLKAARPAEAEQVYRADLEQFPENGWSLFGLARALEAQGKKTEAADIEARFQKVWSDADVTLASTCYCQS